MTIARFALLRSAARSAACAAIVGTALAAGAAFAQPAPTDALYRQLGGEPGVASLIDVFIVRILDDPRVGRAFVDVDRKVLKTQLVAQFCEITGGPCKRIGKDMKTVHSGQDVTMADFNAIVEVLQQSMDAQGIAFGTQRHLLALLAPMHRDIVNVP